MDATNTVFSDKAQAEVCAIAKNEARKPNKAGKIVGRYKVFTANKDGVTKFAVAKSPAGASASLLIDFGIAIERETKAIIEKLAPKDYLALCSDTELDSIELEIQNRKSNANAA